MMTHFGDDVIFTCAYVGYPLLFAAQILPCPLAPASSMPSKVFILPPPPRRCPNRPPDLIRHGKHHKHDVPENTPSPTRAHHHQQPQAPHQPQSLPSPSPREAAEIIVNEEREARLKMPSYKGLENFTLLDKMGESVIINKLHMLLLTSLQRCILKCVQGYRQYHWKKGCRYVIIHSIYTHIPSYPPSSQGRSQI